MDNANIAMKNDALTSTYNIKDDHLYNIRVIRTHVEYIQKHFPDVNIDSILDYAGFTRYDLEDYGYWYTQDQANRFHKIFVEKTGFNNLARESGRLIANGDSFKTTRQFLFGFISPCTAYRCIERFSPKLTRGGTLQANKLGPNNVEIVAKPVDGVVEKPFQCQNRMGILEGICMPFTGRYARIDHVSCLHKGGDCCKYIISWDNSKQYYLNRIRSYLLISIFIMLASTAFILPYQYWINLSMALTAIMLGFCWHKEHQEKKELGRMVEDQADTAELLMHETDKRHDNAALIHELSNATSTIIDHDEILDKIIFTLKKHLSINRSLIMLLSDNGKALQFSKGHGLDTSEEEALKSSSFLLDNSANGNSIYDILEMDRPVVVKRWNGTAEVPEPLTVLSNTSSYIMSPIKFKHEKIGILILDNEHLSQPLNQSDLNIIMSIAHQIGISLNNARSFQKLQLSEKNYRLVIEHACEGIIVTHNGSCIFCNQRTNEILGCSENELLSKSILELIHSDDRKAAVDNWERTLEGENCKEILTLRMLHNDGSIRVAELKQVAISWHNSNALLYFINDITEKKEAEKTLEKLNDYLEDKVNQRTLELQKSYDHLHKEIEERKRVDIENKALAEKLSRSQKMEALGLLAAGVAHDLNNVLSGIVSYPDLILMNLPDDSLLRKPVQTILESGKKAASIVEDLLTLARRGVIQTSVLNINEHIVNDYLTSSEYERLTEEYPSFHIKTQLDPNLLNIRGSRVHLRKSLINLIINALEAQSYSGTIFIETRNAFIDKPIYGYDTVLEGDYAVISVSDSGIGIDKETVKRIFEPFYTNKVMGRSGTGLGMTIVWGTIQDHNGYINVTSEVNKGTIIELYFPVCREIIEEEKTSNIPIQMYMGSGEKILVVDDIKEQRLIATDILEKLNYEVIAVSSGEKAVEYLFNNSADLIILDMIMEPGIDGLETYKRIIKNNPGQKAVISSGYSENDRVKEVQSLGAGAYIQKPYSMENLGVTIKKELGKPLSSCSDT